MKQGFSAYTAAQDHISELHGNTNLESCARCGKEYLRDFRAVAPDSRPISDHRTGRKCALCRGDLHDSLIHFGEDLPEQALQLAFDHAKRADLCLVLGSSLTVTPANEIPETVGKRKDGKLILCNLQTTPMDRLSKIRVYSKSDDVMTRVMRHLALPIPPFILQRRLIINITRRGGERGYQITLHGIDSDGTPASFLRSAKVGRAACRTEPFVFSLREQLVEGTECKVHLEFMGHYAEPSLEIMHVCGGRKGEGRDVYALRYDLSRGVWAVDREEPEEVVAA